MTIINTPMRLLLLIGLAIMQVSSNPITKNPIPDLVPPTSNKSHNDTSTDSAALYKLHSSRWKNGTISYYGWSEEMLPNLKLSPRRDPPVPPQNVSIDVKECGGRPIYFCDTDNKAATSACDILIKENLAEEEPIPPWAHAVCYQMDWDVTSIYQCCTSWTGIQDPIKATDLQLNAAMLFDRCNFYDDALGWNFMSGRVTRLKLGGKCVTQCLSNRAEECF